MGDVYEGIDELGVLLMGHKKEVYWYGSVLSIHEARALAPYNIATSLQVVAGVLAGLIWAIKKILKPASSSQTKCRLTVF
jgi:homospermidine synthase